MSKSLQDQLLALGLAKEQASKPSKPAQHGGKKAGGRNPGQRPAQETARNSARPRPSAANRTATRPAAAAKSAEDISLEQAYRIRENQEKSEKLKQRERKQEEDRLRAVLNREIRQIVEAGRLNLPEAPEARYFMYKDRIRKIHVTAEQLLDLNSGKLGVVYLAGGYHLLNMDQVDAVRKLSPAHVPELLTGEADDEEFWAAEGAAQDEGIADLDNAPAAEPEAESDEPGTETSAEAEPAV